jgi:prevent-host-death family protein
VSARDIRTVTQMKARTAQILDEVNSQKRPLIITQEGKPRAVILDVESYDELISAIGILKLIALGEDEMRADNWMAQSKTFASLNARLKKLSRGK